MTTDKITTVVGIMGAVATGAQPVLNAASGSMHQSDYFSLATAVAMSIWAWFTNKGSK